MGSISVLRDDNGVPLAVTMSFEQFRSLAPEEAERLLDDESLAALASEQATGPFYPFELTERILDGVAPLKVYREWRGLTQQHLADRVGLSVPYISRLETGRAYPSRKTQRRLAQALDIAADMLEPYVPEEDGCAG